MEEGFFLDGVALDAADIAPGHKQGSTPVVANLTNAGLPVWDLATVPAGKTPHPVAVELFIELALANVFIMISRSVCIGAKRSAEANVSYLLFDTCRAEIYRCQRNS